MVAEKKQNEIKTVSWYLSAKNLIKFIDDENSYKLTDKVIAANDFKQYPILKGNKVEVAFENGQVSYLRKVKSETPKSVAPVSEQGKGSEEAYEPTAEEQKPKAVDPNPVASVPSTNPQAVGEVKELTIFAVAQNKKVVKFLEIKDDGWFTIDPSIQAKDYQEIGLIAKNKAKVQIVENNVVSFEKVAVEASVAAPQSTPEARSEAKKAETTTSPVKTAEAPKKEYIPKTDKDAFYYIKELERKIRFLEDNKQESIEIQSAIGSAAEIVGRVAASISPAPTANVINSMLSAVAKENYKLIQELKKTK